MILFGVADMEFLLNLPIPLRNTTCVPLNLPTQPPMFARWLQLTPQNPATHTPVAYLPLLNRQVSAIATPISDWRIAERTGYGLPTPPPPTTQIFVGVSLPN